MKTPNEYDNEALVSMACFFSKAIVGLILLLAGGFAILAIYIQIAHMLPDASPQKVEQPVTPKN